LDSRIRGNFQGTYTFFFSRNDAGLYAGFIKFRFPEIHGDAVRAVEQNQKYLLAPWTAEAKSSSVQDMGGRRTPNRKATKGTLHFRELIFMFGGWREFQNI